LRKILKIAAIVTGAIALAAVAFAIWFAYLFASYKDVERARYISPDGALDAVVVDRLTNATVEDPVLLYVVPHAAKVNGEPVLRSDDVYGLTVTWTGPHVVAVHADNAEVYQQISDITISSVSSGSIHISYDIPSRKRGDDWEKEKAVPAK
jgi:hypothetical protein